MAGDTAHADLLKFFPGAVSAICDGIWASVTTEDRGEEAVRCPVCARTAMSDAIWRFVPPRFCTPVSVAADVTAWVQRGMDAQGLYLAGPVGTGKTHAAWMAVSGWCVVTGTRPVTHNESPYEGRWVPPVVFTRMTDLLDDLRPGDDAKRRVRDCQDTRLLVIDDIGAEKASEWTQERLYSIIDHRYANCRPLIVTSNLPPAKLVDQAGERTASRLAEMCQVVPVTGTDRRKQSAA